MQEFRDKPYQAALEAIVSGRYLRQVIRWLNEWQANGTSTDSFVSRCQQDINEGNLTQEEQTFVKDVAGVIFIGAVFAFLVAESLLNVHFFVR
jgi:hypothetical protein